MGLTAHDMSDMGRLAQLAMNPRDGASREEIYLAVASLYRIQGTGLNNRERELMREILRRLTRDVEMAIRIALAERLADDATAPHDLILLLVDDSIEVARPLILRSPLLTEKDTLRLIAEASVSHQEAVAGRAHIGIPVTDALVNCEAESVLVALVRNATARISDTAYQTLVDRSRAIPSLQEPLVRRPDLPVELANRMCAWVSDALKVYIANNYQIAAKRVDTALSEATEVLSREPAGPKDPPADSAQKLIEKLAASGQLKAGFLMRVLEPGPDRPVRPCLRPPAPDRPRPFPPAFLRRGRAAGGAGLPRRRHRQVGVRHRVQPLAPGPPGSVQSWAAPKWRKRRPFSPASPGLRRWTTLQSRRADRAFLARQNMLS